MRVFVWLAVTRGGNVIGCEASRENVEEYAREILPPRSNYRIEQWEVGESRAGPTIYEMTTPMRADA